MKKPLKRALVIAAAAVLLITAVGGILTWRTHSRVTEIDMSASPDGAYTLRLLQTGEPDFPYGSTHAALVLMRGTDTVSECRFDLANDGKNLDSENWQVTWEADRVTVTITGEEQANAKYILFFDGRMEEN